MKYSLFFAFLCLLNNISLAQREREIKIGFGKKYSIDSVWLKYDGIEKIIPLEYDEILNRSGGETFKIKGANFILTDKKGTYIKIDLTKYKYDYFYFSPLDKKRDGKTFKLRINQEKPIVKL